MEVRALQLGFDNVTLRQVGDVFDLPDDVVLKTTGPLWFEPTDLKLKARFAKRTEDLADMSVNSAKQMAARDKEIVDLARAQSAAPRPSQGESTTLKV